MFSENILLWSLTLLLWWWLLFVFSFSGWGNCMRLVWSGEQEGRLSKAASCPAHIGVFDFFFLNRNWVAEFSNFCMPWWWLRSSEYQLGVWGRGCFFKEKIESSIPRVFWGGGLECFTTWVKDGKFLVCKSEFYAQWAKHCMTLVANFTASC